MPHSSTTVSLDSASSQDSFRATTAPTPVFASSSKWEGQRGRVPKKILGSISVKFHRLRALKIRIKREMRLRMQRGALPVIRIHGTVTKRAVRMNTTASTAVTTTIAMSVMQRRLRSGRSTTHAPGTRSTREN